MRGLPAEPDADPALVCDFVGGALGHRLRAGIGRREPLARAVGLRLGRVPRVVDATAGCGRDAALLAALAVPVTMIERSAAMHAALTGGLDLAARAAPPFPAIVGRLTLIHGDARDHLARLRPEVVVVDPMHPARRKTALVKQPMRTVRELVGPDEDAAELIRCALLAASDRVVVKWPARAPLPAALPRPHHTIAGGTVRYDVFLSGASGVRAGHASPNAVEETDR